jgi:hypothetical protein
MFTIVRIGDFWFYGRSEADGFDLLRVVLYKLKFCARHESVIGAGDKPTHGSQGLHARNFRIHGCTILPQRQLVHAADTAQLTAVFFSRRRELIAPNAHLDGEHGIDAAFQPDGEQQVDFAVAVHRYDVDAMRVDQLSDLFVVRADQFAEYIGMNERTGFEADILPEMCVVEFDSGFSMRSTTL